MKPEHNNGAILFPFHSLPDLRIGGPGMRPTSQAHNAPSPRAIGQDDKCRVGPQSNKAEGPTGVPDPESEINQY